MNEKEIQDAVDYFTETKSNFNSDAEHYVQILIQAIIELDEEVGILAYENRAMAETLEELGYDIESLIFKHKEG